MKIVLDSVILVRGMINPASASGRVVFDYSEGLEWIVSPEIVAEYLEVIGRPAITRKYRAASQLKLPLLLELLDLATLVKPVRVPAVCRDPGDDKFLAAALAGEASFNVSEDKDLLDLGAYEGVEVCTVETFLRHIGQ